MTHVGYPRPGQPIAPKSLREILGYPVLASLVRRGVPADVLLCDLDATAWDRWDRETCHLLGVAVTTRVQGMARPLPELLLKRPLPQIPRDLELADLGLEARTYNALKRAGFADQAMRLNDATIGDILAIRGCGPKCLVDLLTALEHHAARHDKAASVATTAAHTRVQTLWQDHRVAENILRIRQLNGVRDIRINDPRLGPTITRLATAADVNGLTIEEILSSIETKNDGNADAERVAAVLTDLREEIEKSQRLTLEEELRSLIEATRPGRHAELIAARLGWDGHGQRTLQEVGEAFELTRERVRQVCARTRKRLQATHVYAPVLDRGLELVSSAVPASAEEVERLLVQRGITRDRFRLDGFETAAEILGKQWPITLTEKGRHLFITSADKSKQDVVKITVQQSRKLISSQGAATLEAVANRVQEVLGQAVTHDVVARVLVKQVGFAWLDQASGWFWISSVSRNRLLNQIRKVLSVSGQIDVSELRDGVRRHHRMNGFAPPRRVLLELCRQAEGYRVEGTKVIADPALDWRKVLASVEQTIVRILQENGCLLARPDLEELCLRQGMSRSTFYATLDNSPVIIKHARGVYGLRGANVPGGMVEALVPRTRKRRVLIDYGWTSTGEVWLGYRLSDAMITSGTFYIPAAMKPHVSGEFRIHVAGRPRTGTLICEETGAWGLSSLFREYEVEADDCLLLVFSPIRREVDVHFGGPDLIDRFQPTDGSDEVESADDPLDSVVDDASSDIDAPSIDVDTNENVRNPSEDGLDAPYVTSEEKGYPGELESAEAPSDDLSRERTSDRHRIDQTIAAGSAGINAMQSDALVGAMPAEFSPGIVKAKATPDAPLSSEVMGSPVPEPISTNSKNVPRAAYGASRTARRDPQAATANRKPSVAPAQPTSLITRLRRFLRKT